MRTIQPRTIQHWIAGSETTGASTRWGPVWNPATGEQQAQVALAEPADVDAAVAAASKAWQEWRDVSVIRGARVMFALRDLSDRRLDEISVLVADEHGKVVSDAKGEVIRGLEVVEYACGIPTLLKGEFSEQLYADAGLPEGVFNVVHGDKVAVDAILDHPGIAAVSFVGSTPIARYVHQRATEAGKRVQALGGAKNHAVVLPDADMAFAANHITAAGYGSAGQRCMAISAVVAVGDAGDTLIAKLKQKAEEINVGPGRDAASDMGPVVTPEARDRITGYVDRGQEAGATLVVDGRGLTVTDYENGFFVGPTLFDQVTTDMDIYTDEIFGPVLVVLRAGSFAEAVDIVNANQYGNGTAIFTSSGQAARKFQREVQVGMIGINVPIPVPMAFYSFGGWKDSLFGDTHVHGPEGIRFYTRAKAITSRWPGYE